MLFSAGLISNDFGTGIIIVVCHVMNASMPPMVLERIGKLVEITDIPTGLPFLSNLSISYGKKTCRRPPKILFFSSYVMVYYCSRNLHSRQNNSTDILVL